MPLCKTHFESCIYAFTVSNNLPIFAILANQTPTEKEGRNHHLSCCRSIRIRMSITFCLISQALGYRVEDRHVVHIQQASIMIRSEDFNFNSSLNYTICYGFKSYQQRPPYALRTQKCIIVINMKRGLATFQHIGTPGNKFASLLVGNSNESSLESSCGGLVSPDQQSNTYSDAQTNAKAKSDTHPDTSIEP